MDPGEKMEGRGGGGKGERMEGTSEKKEGGMLGGSSAVAQGPDLSPLTTQQGDQRDETNLFVYLKPVCLPAANKFSVTVTCIPPGGTVPVPFQD